MTFVLIVVLACLGALAFSEKIIRRTYISMIEKSPPQIRSEEKIITYPLA